MQLAAASFHVSPKTVAKWVRRYHDHGAAGLGDRSSRPRRCPRTTSSPLQEKVLALRRLRYNGGRIAITLGLSRATVSRILRRAGMNRLRSLDPADGVIDDTGKHMPQVGFGVETVELGRTEEGIEDSRSFSAAIGAGEEIVAAELSISMRLSSR